MLHILSNSPFKIDISVMFNMLSSQDGLIALQDGVLIALNNNFFISDLIKYSKNIYVLQEDVLIRGISDNISSKIKLINYCEFVTLTEKYNKFINW
ncbi:sulfurtransferase complex subunit TusB [Buchnera aphidicola]|uniref:Sulfurtransferase complex subunit TusB n=1 Tax=Buchnera aphidicola (Therioaphis trifolii) TaxID=1241884 RepID=A0A4D6YDZ7_9GAMM|nr:sulfurtransferase complex subunit TusB [Buchnera aphidicola]QCI27342.1 sulfurtransferase complex subunit TusB [Buchnera aphidicola (Therioaphis trifolii)]